MILYSIDPCREIPPPLSPHGERSEHKGHMQSRKPEAWMDFSRLAQRLFSKADARQHKEIQARTSGWRKVTQTFQIKTNQKQKRVSCTQSMKNVQLHRERQQIQARLKSTVTLNQQHNATGGTSEQQRNPFERATKKQKTFSCCRNVTTSDGSLILSCQNSLTYHTSNLAIKWAAWRAACY